MHIHILGICGTFMAGIAKIALALGHRVTGSDQNVYPPMSTLLEKEGIVLINGYDPSQLNPSPDLVIIGNAISRGNPCVEYILDNKINYVSAPQWLHDNVLYNRWVLAVAGTHGKTTTAGMIAWMLTACGRKPGYIIGGVPGNFEFSAELGDSDLFVIEADEYDCAFFDKRSKFMHYCPTTLVLNNLEYDHADIFDSLADIQKQFQYLIRLVPSTGKILLPKQDTHLHHVIERGCWSEREYTESDAGWQGEKITPDASHFYVKLNRQVIGEVNWNLVGEHNMHNALMAIAAVHHAGIPVAEACQALNTFINARRRLELIATVNENIRIFDDFAHHPTAIMVTLDGLRKKVGGNTRILAVLEPRSNTMKLGVCKDELVSSLVKADEVFLFQPDNIQWSIADMAAQCTPPAKHSKNIDELVEMITSQVKANDVILIMSNGGFGGIYQKIIERLSQNR